MYVVGPKKIKIYFKIGRSTRRFVFFKIYFLFLHTCCICVCFQHVAFLREHLWHKAMVMRYSMGLELTFVCSLKVFSFGVVGLYKGYSPFFRVCLL